MMGRSGFVAVLVLMALPAVAEDCVPGRVKQVTFDDGSTTRVIQRHGADVTLTTPYAGGNDVVAKSHLALVPKQTRMGSRFLEYRWDDRLPPAEALVPGFHYDVAGTMKSGDAAELAYRIVGEVRGAEIVTVGTCDYPVVVVSAKSYIEGVEVVASTVWLSTEMLVGLRSEGQDAGGTRFAKTAVGLE